MLLGVLVIIMTCHVCRGAAAGTTTVTTTEDRTVDPETEMAPPTETGGRGLAGTSLTLGPVGSGVRAQRGSLLRKETKGTPLGPDPAVIGTGGQRGGTRGGPRQIGGRATEPTGTGETRGRWRRGGNGTK